MGLFDTIGKAMRDFDYDGAADRVRGAVEKKQGQIIKNFQRQLRTKSDDQLRYKMRQFEDEGRDDDDMAKRLLQEEMDRRGIYY